MRTDDSRPRDSASRRLRDAANRAWRWASERGPRTRLILGGTALAVLISAGYGLSSTPTTAETAWLYEGHHLSDEDVQRALSALAVAKIPAKAGPHGQIAVAVDRRGDALALLKKENLGPRSLHDLREAAETTSPFAWPGDRGEKRDRLNERNAELLISGLDGIASADVLINRAPGRSPGSRSGKLAVLVRVQPDNGQPLLPQSLHAIQAILKMTEPDLSPDSLTVLDRTGRTYLEAGNPEVGAATMAHVREEELGGKIKDKLDWINGVRVFVTLEAAPPATPAAAPSAPAVIMNAPAELPDPPAPAPLPATGKATILVQVPISDYLRRYQAMHHRHPSLDDLRPFVSKTEDNIRSMIRFVIPDAEIASLKIDRIDDPGPSPPPAAPLESQSPNFRTWWVPAGVASAVVLVLMMTMGTRWLATRRPAPIASAVPRAHFEVNDDAGPSGRVRELVRRDPAAAAGVLHRWIGQGGHAS